MRSNRSDRWFESRFYRAYELQEVPSRPAYVSPIGFVGHLGLSGQEILRGPIDRPQLGALIEGAPKSVLDILTRGREWPKQIDLGPSP
jgi:hypothetical protein